MRNWCCLLTCWLLLFTAGQALALAKGEAAPDFSATSLDGQPFSLSAQRGKVVVMIYWRTDQDRSLAALKDLTAVFSELGHAAELQAVTVIPDNDDQARARTLLKDNHLQLPVVRDIDRNIYSGYQIRVFPTTMIIDQEGKLTYDIPSHPPDFRNLLHAYLGRTLGVLDEAGMQALLAPKPLTEDPASVEAKRRYQLALKFADTGMLELATDSVVKALEAKPDLVEAQVLYGFLLLKDDQVDAALKNFKQALAAEPHNFDAATGLGAALVDKGDLDQALEVLQQAIPANPHPLRAQYELGRAYAQKGEKDQALRIYREALDKLLDEQLLPSSALK